MLEREKGRVVVTCDNCGDGFEANDFYEAKEQMDEEGWKYWKEADVWNHLCGACKRGK